MTQRARFTHDSAGTTPEAWSGDPRWAALPVLDLPLDLGPDVERLVVVAAHPDDESLGAGALVARAHRRGLEVVVVCATDGEASHPDSPTHTPADLAAVRRRELHAALDGLAPASTLHLLGRPDGALGDHQDTLRNVLVDLIGDGERTLVVAPWRHDGHPDHDAAGRAAAAAAARTGARLVEYPIWFWHWASPDGAPWEHLAALVLDDVETLARAAAQGEHRSQVAPLSEHPGDKTLLGPDLLRHFTGPRETYVVQPVGAGARAGADTADTALEDLHAASTDPWGVDSRFYEARKRALLLAALPRVRFRHGLEIGGSTGALAADLASRCEDLLVLEAGTSAVSAARERLAPLQGVRVEQARVPQDWPVAPEEGYDLVVLSEVGYFLSPSDLRDLLTRVRLTLAPDGVLVLCHWRHEVVGWALDGPEVHRRAIAADLRPVVATYADRDMELLVLADPGCLPDPRGTT